MKTLTVRQIEALKCPPDKDEERFRVGKGLYMNVRADSMSWLYRYSFAGKRSWWGRGEYSRAGNSLQVMLEKAHSYQNLIKEGVDPKQYVKEQEQAEVRKKAQGISFKEAAEEWIQHKTNGDWKTAKSVQRGRQYITDYAIPVLGHKAVIDIQVEDIVKVLKPDWETKTPTMTRLMGYLEAVIARGLHSAKATNQANPAVLGRTI
jgi:hypothetical protein